MAHETDPGEQAEQPADRLESLDRASPAIDAAMVSEKVDAFMHDQAAAELAVLGPDRLPAAAPGAGSAGTPAVVRELGVCSASEPADDAGDEVSPMQCPVRIRDDA